MKSCKFSYVLLAIVVALIVCGVSFPSERDETPSNVSNLNALAKPQESTGYIPIENKKSEEVNRDSFYIYYEETIVTTCMSGGNKECTSGTYVIPYKLPK